MPEAICLYMDIYSTTSLQEFIKLFGSVVLGNGGTTSQRFLEKVRSFIKSCKMVFSANPITGAPEVSLDFQPACRIFHSSSDFYFPKKQNANLGKTE